MFRPQLWVSMLYKVSRQYEVKYVKCVRAAFDFAKSRNVRAAKIPDRVRNTGVGDASALTASSIGEAASAASTGSAFGNG